MVDIIINRVLDFMAKHNSDLHISIKRSRVDNKLCLYATCKTCKQENRYVI